MAILTTCSGCGADTHLHPSAGYVVVNADEEPLYDDGELLTWDCPSCGYADSYWSTCPHDEWKEYRNG